MPDLYVDPVTGVFYNRLGIADEAELRRLEYKLAGVVEAEMLHRPEKGAFDLPHLQRIHRRLFEHVYDWAGQLRCVEISKGVYFCSVPFLENFARSTFTALHDERYLVGLARDETVSRLAYFYSEVNALHPFREGNGRTQRIFFRDLMAGAGWRIGWEQVNPQENIDACRYALSKDESMLADMFDRVLTRLGTVRDE